MSLRDALDRTLLLVRDEVEPSVRDDTILAALTAARIVLVADTKNLASHSAQTAFVTAALLMARSGHTVHLLAPDVPMLSVQLPLANGQLITELFKVGADLLPGVEFSPAAPAEPIDLIVTFGDTSTELTAHRVIRLNATDWSGSLVHEMASAPWRGADWPLGALAAAVLAAGEAFKCAIHKLAHIMRNPDRLNSVFAPTDEIEFHLAPETTPTIAVLGAFDCISGGAIIHAVLYVLSRLPGLRGYARIIEPDTADVSNLNRYVMLRRSTSKLPKAEHLEAMFADTGLEIDGLSLRYDALIRQSLRPGPAVLVGVDDIPTRWEVQRANPEWLAIGATTHWSAMASFHKLGIGCAECAHPYDDPGAGRIPTAAFISFWAGLLTASYFLRHVAESDAPVHEQQIFLPAFHADNADKSPVFIRASCPSCSAARVRIDSDPIGTRRGQAYI